MEKEQIIEKDLDAIYIGNLNTVDENLKLPLEGKYGSTFTWDTGESRFIEKDGTVHRPLHGMGNRKVILTVKALYGGCTGERVFTATVLQEAKEKTVTEIRPVSLVAETGHSYRLPSVVIVHTAQGSQTTVPVIWEEAEILEREGMVEVEGKIEDSEKKALARITFRDHVEKKKGEEKKIRFFPISDVRLKKGTLYQKYQQYMLDWLLGVDDGQMLYNFRKAAGLDTCGAAPMTGWDEESCKLKGHTTGHYLSGLALAYAATGDTRFRENIRKSGRRTIRWTKLWLGWKTVIFWPKRIWRWRSFLRWVTGFMHVFRGLRGSKGKRCGPCISRGNSEECLERWQSFIRLQRNRNTSRRHGCFTMKSCIIRWKKTVIPWKICMRISISLR